jgi:hypothetical protein
MADEIVHDAIAGQTLYSVRWQSDGTVFLTDGSSAEVWGTDGRDAGDYDVSMSESGSDGHYVGDFDTDGNISEGVYQVAVFIQAGGSPADADLADSRGQMHWDGTKEENIATIGDQMDRLSAQKSQVFNRYPTRSQQDG